MMQKNASIRLSTARTKQEPVTAISQTPAGTVEERLERIQALGERIAEHIVFMCRPGTPSGTSTEVKEKAVEAFYERLIVVERQLGLIKEGMLLE
jgi:hypothetical protein